MDGRCYRTGDRKNYKNAESTGWRATFYFPGRVTYSGCWLNSKHHRYGVKQSTDRLIYDGQWHQNKRQGYGTMRRGQPDGTAENIYIGQWHGDKKCGEGAQYFNNGLYYGWWSNNRRHGLGMMWYTDTRFYVGEWQADVHHGLGVLFYENGNRYEGHFARGYKNGEGTFYHMHTGQIQKGMWENDVCKASVVQDEFRGQADRPTQYPITKCCLAEPDAFIRKLFQKYMNNANKPTKSFHEIVCLNFTRKMKKYAKFEPKAVSNSLVPFDDINYSCMCKYEKN